VPWGAPQQQGQAGQLLADQFLDRARGETGSGPLGGELLGPVILGTNTAGNLVAFAPASETPGDLALRHRWQLSTPGSGWSPWKSLGKPPGDRSFTQVVAAHNADGHLEVFTVADDGQVWHRWQQRADDPGSWEQPPGTAHQREHSRRVGLCFLHRPDLSVDALRPAGWGRGGYQSACQQSPANGTRWGRPSRSR
jgi:hypothetical protein